MSKLNLSQHEEYMLYSQVLTKEWKIIENDNGSITLELIDIYSRTKSCVLPMPIQDFYTSLKKMANGSKIQNAFPYFTHTQREFMLTGLDDEEWDDLMGEDQ